MYNILRLYKCRKVLIVEQFLLDKNFFRPLLEPIDL